MSVIGAPESKAVTPASDALRAVASEEMQVAPEEIQWQASRPWRWTAGSGLALVVLATLHIVAQHFVASGPGGLRTYHEVLHYISSPVIFILECGFLLAVTVHAMLGVRSILLDFDLGARTCRHLDKILWTVGTLTVGYGVALLIALASRA
ncbi:MAG: hypothetical protein ACLP0J_12345 [Solirubrobacteraceae bacterium]|jgi:succinate dehydrogenase hydrophobic anchor subunit